MRYLLTILVVTSVVLLAVPQSVSAASTPEFCEAVKYGCSTVDYSVSGSTATVSNRWYKGSTGGLGADAWQLYWVYDWSCGSSICTRVNSSGESAWRTNATYDFWYGRSGGTINFTSYATINFKFRYDSNTPPPAYWCSWEQEHNLASNWSYQAGSHSCYTI